MLTVWGRRTSSNVQALMWCIGELGLAYRRHEAGHIHGITDTPGFLAMNPNGTVPVLRDGEGEPLWETSAILRYLAGRYAAAPFWSDEGPARAHVDRWAEWAKINVTLGFTAPIFWRVVRTAPVHQDPAAIGDAVAKLDRLLDIAETQLSRGAFLAGDDSPWPTSSSVTCCSATSTFPSPAEPAQASAATTTRSRRGPRFASTSWCPTRNCGYGAEAGFVPDFIRESNRCRHPIRPVVRPWSSSTATGS